MKSVKVFYKDFNFDNFNFGTIVKTKVGRKNEFVVEFPASFDIETSELPIPIGKIDAQPFMHGWQFYVQPYTIYGSTWAEFNDLCTKLNSVLANTWLVVCVHNFDFEFSFMQSWVKFTNVFRNSFSPDKIYYAEIGHLKFIDTAKISKMDLETFTAQVEHKKLHTYDYDALKFADDVPSLSDLQYREHDVVGCAEATVQLMEHEKISDLLHLPLTEAGFSKALGRENHKKNKYTVKIVPEGCLRLLQKAARGGNTWCPKATRGKLFTDPTDSFDSNSMYSTVMVSEKYPIGNWSKVDDLSLDNILYYLARDYAGVFKVTFKNLKLKNPAEPVPYVVYRHDKGDVLITENKYPTETEIDNDRVLACKFFTCCVTDLDLKIINDTYDYENLIFEEAWFSKYGYLPAELRKLIISMWIIKENAPAGPERDRAKRFINTLYGAMGQNPIYPQLVLDENGEPIKDDHGHYKKTEQEYKAAWWAWYSYAWFVWTAAHSRARLQQAILLCGGLLRYCDTDCAKFPKGKVSFKALNEKIKAKNLKAGAPAGMGQFRSEYTLGKFVALGSKQWAGADYKKIAKNKITEKDLVITCSGLKTCKSDALDELKEAGGIAAFKPGFVFQRTGYGPVKVVQDAHIIEYHGHRVEVGCGRLIRPRPAYPLQLGDTVLSPDSVDATKKEIALQEDKNA